MTNYISQSRCVWFYSALAFSLLLPVTARAMSPVVNISIPTEGFVGESFCGDANFSNVGSPGYGPYLRVVLPPDISFDAATFVGSATNTQTVGTFPAAPGNQLEDPYSMDMVTGPDGGTLILIELPLGSVVSGGPMLTVNFCATITNGATIGTPLTVSVTPAYRYGDTPTGDNGPIVGAEQTAQITPVILTFEKTNDAPESERTPGASFPYTYTLSADIAAGETVHNLVFADTLPANVQYVGPITVTGGSGVTVVNEPSTITPGGSVQVDVTSALGGAGGDDVTVAFPVHLTDTLDESNCATALVSNAGTLDAEYPMGTAQPQVADMADVTAKHIAIQKSVSPSDSAPGQTVTYTLDIQISEFATATNLVAVDTLPDGTDFGSVTLFEVDGSAGSITPSQMTNPDQSEEITFDVTAVTGNLVGASTVRIQYTAIIQQTYANTGEPVRAADVLSNTVVANYALLSGATGCSDGSGAAVTILPVQISKSIVNVQARYAPGETITFRLEMAVPSGDTQAIIWDDFFPLPSLRVTSIDTANFGPAFDIRHAPTDTLGLTPDSITINASTNLLRIEWPSFTSTSTETIAVDVDVVVNNEPTAPMLFLTNLFQASSENTPGIIQSEVTPVAINIGAPKLVLTHGVSASDNSNSTIDPAPAMTPVDGDVTDADGGDTITYTITVENQGDAPAHDVVVALTEPTEFTGCSVVSVLDGTGAMVANSGDLFGAGLSITNAIPANDENPVGGGPPFDTDTVIITYTCQMDTAVEPEVVYTSSASVDWASQPGATGFPSESDDATTTIASPGIVKTRDVTSESHTSGQDIAIGETIQYLITITVPEGTSSGVTLTDSIPDGLGLLSLDSIIVSDPGAVTTDHAGGFAGVLSDATPASPGGCPTSGATAVSFPFDNIQNTDTDDGTDETIEIRYTVRMCDQASNTANKNLDNDADWNWNGGSSVNDNVRATVRLPVLQIAKTPTPSTADAGDTISYSVTISHPSASRADAFDLVITDTFSDSNLSYVGGSLSAPMPGTIIDGDQMSDTQIEIHLDELQDGSTYTFTFQATLAATTPVDTEITNTVMVDFDTLPAGTPGTPDANERSLSNSGMGTVTTDAPMLTKSVISTSEAHTGVAEHRNMITDLVVGEEVTFEITATLPEGRSTQVVITDVLASSAAGVLEVLSGTVVSVGGQLTAGTPSPTPMLADNNLSDGLDDTVTFNFGQVDNAPDGLNNSDDQIVVRVVARVADVMSNADGDALTSTASLDFSSTMMPPTVPMASADVDLVEPAMDIDKAGDSMQADAGAPVTYTVQVGHLGASTADMFDIRIQDVLPAGLTYEAGSLMHTSGVAPTSISESGGTITVTYDTLALGSASEFEYQARPNQTVVPDQMITNTANATWSSQPAGTPTANDANERGYSDNDGHTVTVSGPSLMVMVNSTSETSTGTAINGGETDLTIGETVTFRTTVTLPEATMPNAMFVFDLPTVNSTLEVVSSRVVSIGGQLSGGGLPMINDAGAASDENTDTIDDRVTWSLGNVVNNADGMSNGADEIEFEVVAVVLDRAENQGGTDDDQPVNASLTFTGGSASGMTAVDIVEPIVDIVKVPVPDPTFADADDEITFRITLDHTMASTADAFNIQVTDVLPSPGSSWISDVRVSGSCGVMVNSTADPTIVFTLASLPLATDSCTIEFDVVVDAGVTPGTTYNSTATLQYDSTPTFVSGETRRTTDMDAAAFTVDGPSLIMSVDATSIAETGTAFHDNMLTDLAIGETVDFLVTATFSEGTTQNSMIDIDVPANLATGLLEIIGGNVVSVGGNLSPANAGTPAFNDNVLTDGRDDNVVFDFGDVVNAADGMTTDDDRIVVRVTARVADIAGNVDATTLTTNGSLSFTSGGPLNASIDVEVVTPTLGITKSFGTPSNNVVPIMLQLNNTGTAPAYDISVSDILNDSDWDTASIAAMTIPAGFAMTTAAGPGAGDTTVTIASDSMSMPPASSIEPSESVTFIFTATLAGGAMPMSSISNTGMLDAADTAPGTTTDERALPTDMDTVMLSLPQLSATKTGALESDNDSSTDLTPGDTVRWTIIVMNTGASAANNVVVADMPDAQTALVVGSVTTTLGTVTTGNTMGDSSVLVSIPTLNAAGSATIEFVTQINSAVNAGTPQIANQATIMSDEIADFVSDDPGTGAADDATVLAVNAAPDLQLTKTEGDVIVAPGGVITYNLDYLNGGNQDASGVVVTETVPANTRFEAASSTSGWSCTDDGPGGICTLSIGGVSAGTGGTVNFALRVDTPLAASVTSVTNNASIADDGSGGTDPDAANNNATDSTTIMSIYDLQLTGSADVTDVAPGGDVQFSLVVENLGNINGTGIVLTATVPPGTTFNASASDSGWSCMDGAAAGTVCTLNVGSLAGGEQEMFIFAVTADNPLPDSTVINLEASVADDGGNGPESTTTNNSTTIGIGKDVIVDLQIMKTDDGELAPAGGVLVYRITATNGGNQHLTGVVINETVPANTTFVDADSTPGWTCTSTDAGAVCTFSIGTLEALEVREVLYAIRVDDPLAAGVTQISNTVSISDDGANGSESAADDNNITLLTFVDALLDLSIDINTVGEAIFDGPGSILVWEVTYENAGQQDATGVVIEIPIPEFSEYLASQSSDGWTHADETTAKPRRLRTQAVHTGPVCRFLIGDLPVGARGTLRLAVRLTDDTPPGLASIDLVAAIRDDGNRGADINTANNSANAQALAAQVANIYHEEIITRTTRPLDWPFWLCGSMNMWSLMLTAFGLRLVARRSIRPPRR